MRKFFGILIMLALFTAAPSAAQFKWGVKAGVNIAEKPTNLGELQSVVKGEAGWFIGPMAKATIPVVGIGIEANVLYSQTNTQVGGTDINSQCIDLPIYLRYELSIPAINRFFEPFIAVGPQWSWNVGDRKFNVDKDWIQGVVSGEDYNYTLRGSNLSLNIGLGAVIIDHIQIHANYNMALGSTSDYRDAKSALSSIESKTNTWQVSVGYIF